VAPGDFCSCPANYTTSGVVSARFLHTPEEMYIPRQPALHRRRGPMNRVVTGSSLPTSENTLEATVEVPVTTAHQLLTGTPAPLLWKVDVEGLEPQVLRGAATQAGSGHNQLWIRDLPFPQQRCRTAAPVRVGRVSL
jgi:hypothetical protein